MNKVKAFTIMEMLVSLAITSIIISLVYFTYTTFAKQIYNYQDTISKTQEFEQFYTQLRTDIFKAEKIYIEDSKLLVENYNGKIIFYKIDKTYLERLEQKRKDKLEIVNIELIKLNEETNLIQKIIVQVQLFEEPLSFEIIKNYPPSLTIQL